MFLRLVFVALLVGNLGADSLSTDKRFGVEANPLYLFLAGLSGSNETFLSGSFSYCNHENLAEITVPFHYMKLEHDDYKQFTIDVHYRKFINDSIGGFYYSGFARFAKLEGESGNSYTKLTKAGVGAGIGFGLFHKSGFYWGMSLSLGAYLLGDNDQFTHSLFVVTDDPHLIVDVELLKFGYTF
ncbi:MAG TPA: hypothetical protein EYH01_04845 [Campylobacterales bacterium]|nr:hypothetical protein [Campylobacterales bacterium]